VDPVELVETIKKLQREVQNYKVNNERLIRAQEEHNQINTQLLQSLNNLKRQINKDSSTKHATTPKSHDRRYDHKGSKHSISVSRHHHSPRPRLPENGAKQERFREWERSERHFPKILRSGAPRERYIYILRLY